MDQAEFVIGPSSPDPSSGLIISDLSDHLPIFVTSGDSIERNVKLIKKTLNIRVMNEESLLKFQDDLSTVVWDSIYSSTDVNEAFQRFQDIFVDLYKKQCKENKITLKDKCNDKPWFHNGLKNACKKKICYIKDF